MESVAAVRWDAVTADLREALGVVAAGDREERTAVAALTGSADPTPRWDVDEVVARLHALVTGAVAERPDWLHHLDAARAAQPDYWEDSAHVGYVAYADRLAGDLAGVVGMVPHLRSLGVTWLHLMPLLRPRPGDSDGGYAVADFHSVDPRLGTVADLEQLTETLAGHGIALCVDVVLNHTAREHAWARAAAAGDAHYRDYYRVFDDATVPNAYSATLPEVFPETAPGSFTRDAELGAWVWTSFRDFQWDLDWGNPDVLVEMASTVLWLANRGVQVLRLDAVPFLWKRLGTDGQNQPEAHALLQVLAAVIYAAAPAVQLLAEAIVPPGQLVPYLGAHSRQRRECDLAYHNQLMVQVWSAVAARDARVAASALSRMRPTPPGTGWVTYVRGHDDIGWAIDDVDARAAGADGAGHRRFLADFYAGRHPGSFARGAVFQENPETGDARTSGTTAQLCGLAADPGPGMRRFALLYSLVYAAGGLPLIWSGDEVATFDDPAWAEVEEQAADNRWAHRPRLSPARLREAETDPASVPGRALATVRGLAAARASCEALRAGGSTTVLWGDAPEILCLVRRHRRSDPLLVLANVADGPASVTVEVLREAGIWDGGALPVVVHGSEFRLDVRHGRLHLPPLGWLWLGPAVPGSTVDG